MFSFKTLIILFIVAEALAILWGGKRRPQIAIIAVILTVGLGYRTVQVTDYLRLHPAELLLWAAFIIIFITRTHSDRLRSFFWLPTWVSSFIPFWLIAWLPGFVAGRSVSLMLSEFKNFLVLIPLFFVAEAALKDEKVLRSAILAFFAVGVWIGCMGLLERFFPAVTSAIPGFAAAPSYGTATIEGFNRATFSFFGATVATFVLVLTIPMTHILWRWYPRHRPLILFALLAQIAGVYIGGYRSMWLTLVIQSTLWVLMSFGPVPGAFGLLPLSFAASLLLPQMVLDRMYTLVLVIQGQAIDSSSVMRIARLSDAWATVLRQPLGIGWAGIGWVHSDFIQIFANLGFIAGMLFIAAWIFTLLRLGRRFLALRSGGRSGALEVSLLLSMIGAGGILWSQGVQVLLQLILPVWVVWVLAEIWLRQSSEKISH
ncbi:MAG: hypothetical protein ISR58_05845 [Anaerolineales bacterium]|nr:hypothetical protein [Chloroflexota bacterium]MBL6980698.1 hypothetical protein [Anaerolineales bacterium]